MRVLIIGKTVGIVELVGLLDNYSYKMFLCIFVKYTYMSI